MSFQNVPSDQEYIILLRLCMHIKLYLMLLSEHSDYSSFIYVVNSIERKLMHKVMTDETTGNIK